MDTSERHEMKGMLTLELRDSTGRVLETRCVQNLITDEGRKFVADLFTGTLAGTLAGMLAGTPKVQIAVGTGNAPALVSDKELTNETTADATAMALDNVVTVLATLAATPTGDTKPIQEAGIIIKIGERRILYNRVTFAVVNKSPQMALVLGWKVVF